MKNLFVIKRFYLLMLFVVIGFSQMYGNNNTYYSRLTGEAAPTGYGKVYIDEQDGSNTKLSEAESPPTHSYVIKAEPSGDYVFDFWTPGTGVTITSRTSEQTNASIVASSEDKNYPTPGTVTANFVLGKRYYAKINTTVSPSEGGSITGDTGVKSKVSRDDSFENIDFTLTANANDDFLFVGWSTSEDIENVLSTDKTETFTVKAESRDSNNPTRLDYYALFRRQVATPIIRIDKSDGRTTISCTTDGATIYYTTDGSTPTASSDPYEAPFIISLTDGVVVKAIAVKDGYADSFIGAAAAGGDGSDPTSPYFVASVSGLNYMAEHPTYHFKVVADFNASGFSSSITNFSGTFDGDYKTISGLTKPLFASTNGATIKNVVLDDVNISGTGNVGGVVATASGATRIYNCGVRASNASYISGTAYTGSIVGHLQGSSRVINCYSFADITGGTTVGGIVGYNATASTSSNLQTLVMNCMYYGDITGGTNKAPIYNGQNITNAGQTGINNYNYYRYSSPYSKNKAINTYNCALAAEERYLVRHEFYRGILNSQRKLCAFYVKGSITDANVQEIDKWVLDPKIAPYPIIKPWGKYPSIINKVPTDPNTPYQGKILGTLNVNISGYGTVQLPITDMDTLNYDYNYYKVQLPYYNDYFDDQYVNHKVVTGWKITSVTGGNAGSFTTTGDDRYNFADRNCTQKDLYSVTGIVFAQGGYYNVPEGVTGITIEPYIATNVAYLSDPYYDKVYSTSYAGYNFTVPGDVPKARNGKTVYNYVDDAIASFTGGSTVYDNAIVLVGNYHSANDTWNTSGNTPFTLMSIDEDRDNEPDYCVFHYHDNGTYGRQAINPVRFDFMWHPSIGMAKKVTGSGIRMPNQGIFRPKGWFEITETCLARYTEFEYDYASKTSSTPLILNNGIFEQFVGPWEQNSNPVSEKVLYMRLGGNVYFEAFTPGAHIEKTGYTKRFPISVLGGEYKEFYLSGVKASANTTASNALCYTNGGRFPMFAGAYMEKIAGNVIVKMDHSFVDEFYGGGVNSVDAQITGDINITINNSLVRFYCGGPKFGSMATGKSVTTNATGTTFGEFYGAGYGGTSYSIQQTTKQQSATFLGGNEPSYNPGSSASDGYVADYHVQFFSFAGGTDNPMGRFYTHYAKLTLATTNSVTSNLTNCTIENDFYGGGCLGKVSGNVTSTLTGCVIGGSVYGGGYSASVPTCPIRRDPIPWANYCPTFNVNTGIYEFTDLPPADEYVWSSEVNQIQDGKIPASAEDLANLGAVLGNTIITINGKTFINAEPESGVYGGGNASKVSGQTNVIIEADANSKINNVFGGANQADVGGETTVSVISGNVGNVFGTNNQSGTKSNSVTISIKGIEDATFVNNVYGGGNLAPYEGNPYVMIQGYSQIADDVYGGGLGETAIVNGNPSVIVSENAKVNGSVFGGGSMAVVTGDPQVNMIGGTVGNLYGGGDVADVNGDPVVTMSNGIVENTVFGGGNAADVEGSTSVTILEGTIGGNVYGGGNQGNVAGATKVQIGQ